MNEMKTKENHRGRGLPGDAGIWEKDKDWFFQPLLISRNEHFLLET